MIERSSIQTPHAGPIYEPNILIVYSPRNVETQVIRPLMMNFDRDSKRDMQYAIGAELSSKHAAYTVTDAMKSSILPDSVGLRIDNNFLGSKFTFMLILSEGGGPTPLGIQASSVKHIASGYFTEQPFSDQFLSGFSLNEREAINPNAVMVFTDVSRNMSGTRYGGHGEVTMRSNVGTDGIYSNGLLPLYGRRDVCMLTPEDLANTKLTKASYSPTPVQGNPFLQDNEVSVQTDQIQAAPPVHSFIENAATPTAIDNHLQSPVVQLNKMIDAISETNMFENNEISVEDTYLSHRAHYGSAFQDGQINGSMIADRLPGREMPASAGIIDFNTPIYVNDLFIRVPMITTQYVKLDMRPQFDVVEQDIISPQTQLSNLATHIVSNICVDLGILGVTIGYQSYTIREGFIDEIPSWFIEDVTLIDPTTSPAQGEAIQKRLLFLLEQNLFTVIKHVAGDFEMLAAYTTGGDALISLTLMSNIDNTPGYTTTPMSWGAGVSNVVGTVQHVTHNAVQLTDVISDNTGMVPTY